MARYKGSAWARDVAARWRGPAQGDAELAAEVDRLRRQVDWLTEQLRDATIASGERLTTLTAALERLEQQVEALRRPGADDEGRPSAQTDVR